MFAAIKNYLIAFAVAITIFGIAGYYLKPVIVDDLVSGFLTPGAKPEAEETGGEAEDTGGSFLPEDTEQNHVEEPKIEGESFTMLLVGSDYQPTVFSDYRCNTTSSDIETLAKNQRRYSADIIMVIRADTQNGILMVTSVPSTLSVSASGINMKLGEVLERKGFTYFTNFVEGIVGLPIDYAIECRISNFIDAIDSIGTVKFNVPVNMYYVDEEERIVLPGASRDPIHVTDEFGVPMYDEKGEPILIPPGRPFTINLTSGIQSLDGEKASHLLRYKSYTDGSVSRCKVQTDFIVSILEQYAKPENKGLLSGMLTKIPTTQKTLSVAEAEDVLDVLVKFSEFETVKVTFPATYSQSAGGEIASYSANAVFATYNKFKLK